MTEFKPGLEGVVAFETEIAEPDRDGGALRYRGVDIEELVGSVPFEQVWGLLVDESPEPGLPSSEDYAARDLTGQTPSDLQTVTARLGGEWGLQKLIDISDDEAKEDLRRISATMISATSGPVPCAAPRNFTKHAPSLVSTTIGRELPRR